MKYIIWDIDGVLADPKDRVHFIEEKNWDAFYDNCDKDAPIHANLHMLEILAMASKNNDTSIMMMTGRPERIRSKTVHWVTNHCVHVLGKLLMMRKDGDHRPDYVVKEEMATELGFENILCVFEDRDQVVEMWRSHGVQCYQTCKGTY